MEIQHGKGLMSISMYTLLIISAILLLIVVLAVIYRLARKHQQPKQVAEYDNDQVYVGNLPYTVNEQDIRQRFAKFGRIHTIKMVKNHKTGRSKGYAFVTYDSAREAIKALNAHGEDMQGRNMVVRIAKPR